jgi:hypothetical protein
MDGLLIMRDLLQKRFACLNIEIIIEIIIEAFLPHLPSEGF